MWVKFDNVTASVEIKLAASSYGKVRPTLHRLKVDFGQSNIYCINAMHQWFLRQWVSPLLVLLENSLTLFGSGMINKQLPRWTDDYLQGQETRFPIEFPEYNKTANMQINWRLTEDPKISDGYIDFAMWFDIGPDATYCSLPQTTTEHGFVDDPNRFFQFVVTDRLVNCYLEALERQGMFHYTISSKYMQEHFGTHTFKINAKLLSGAYPVISKLYGPNQELELEFKLKKPAIGFGIPENDIGFRFDFDFGIKLAGDMNFILYDELHLKWEGDIVFDQETLFGEISKIQLEQAGENKGSRVLPVYNSIALTHDHYE